MGGTDVSREIVESVARQEGVLPEELDPPLSEVINTDALEELFEPVGNNLPSYGKVEFLYRGYLVVMTADGDVTVKEPLGVH